MKLGRITLLVLAALTFTGCGGGKHDAATPAGQAIIIKGIPLEEVKEREVEEFQEGVGTVKAVTSAVVSARIAGVLTTIHVKEGDRVRKGQAIATIESNEASAGAAAARAGVDEARKGLEEAASRKKLADATFQRYQALFSEQAVTRQEFETRQTEQEVAAQGVSRAEARLAQVRENARAAAAMADYTKVVSPIGGIVTAKQVDRGATLFPGMPIVTVEDDSALQLEVQVPESLKGRVAVGKPVDIAFDGQQLQKGRVVEMVPVVDPGSRTFTVKVAVLGKGLRSGMYGRAFFPVGKRKGIAIPRSAVIERGALTSVWVVDSQKFARMRLVKPGKAVGDRVEILSGLVAGEHIAPTGIDKITDGAKVE